VDPISAQMGQADVSVVNATHVPLRQEARYGAVDPPPAPFNGIARPARLTSPIETR